MVCVCVFFLNKKYIFSYTFDLCGRVGKNKFFNRPISGNKTTFFGLTLEKKYKPVRRRQNLAETDRGSCYNKEEWLEEFLDRR